MIEKALIDLIQAITMVISVATPFVIVFMILKILQRVFRTVTYWSKLREIDMDIGTIQNAHLQMMERIVAIEEEIRKK